MSYLGQQLGQGQAERFVYTATGGETSVTSDDAGRAIAYTVGQVDVYLNGAKLINGSDFTATTGTSITGLAALTASDVVEVFALSIFQASDTVSASTGGTFNGNITINADLTVDTNTLFVDASADAVGIGTSSPNSYSGFTTLTLDGTSGSLLDLEVNGTLTGEIYADASFGIGMQAIGSRDIQFKTNNTERMRIDSSGNVGIGTASPLRGLDVRTAASSFGNTFLVDTTSGTTGTGGGVIFGSDDGLGTDVSVAAIQGIKENSTAGNQQGALLFTTKNSSSNQIERMRIDSSGNLNVGCTDGNSLYNNSGTNTGAGVLANGQIQQAVYQDVVHYANRTGNDGTITSFQKDGTTVGSIGTDGTTTYIAGASKALKLEATRFIPRDSDDTSADATVDLGGSVHRFKDLYLSGGVYLGGTGSANKLDDYEEGTWTPTCVCSGQTITTTQAIGKYTKIGRIVHAECAIIINTVSGTASGATTITGLPFTNDGDGYSGMGALNYNDGFVNTLYASWIQSTTAYMRSGTRSQSNDGGGFSAGGYINIRWSYITNA